MKHNCIVCQSDNTRWILDIPDVPVYCNVFWDSKTEAINAPKGDISLRYCENCDHLFNVSFDISLLDYNVSYDASLHFSATFQQYADRLSSELLNRYQLDDKTVIEIACGKGDFLKLLAEKSNARLIGFDPSYDGRHDEYSGITIINDYYGSQYRDYQADLIVCRHALEHLEMPTDFLRQLSDTFRKDKPVHLFFEMPNALFLLKDLSIWDFIYEHISYFSSASLQHCFQQAGYQVDNCYASYAEQFLCIEGQGKGTGKTTKKNNIDPEAADYIVPLKQHYQEKIHHWNKLLSNSNEKVVLWGAGSKGVTFLNLISAAAKIEYIVDLNVNKQGKYVPGTGQHVISPKQLTEYAPDRIIIMNPIYQKEIETMLLDMDLTARVSVV